MYSTEKKTRENQSTRCSFRALISPICSYKKRVVWCRQWAKHCQQRSHPCLSHDDKPETQSLPSSVATLICLSLFAYLPKHTLSAVMWNDSMWLRWKPTRPHPPLWCTDKFSSDWQQLQALHSLSIDLCTHPPDLLPFFLLLKALNMKNAWCTTPQNIRKLEDAPAVWPYSISFQCQEILK